MTACHDESAMPKMVNSSLMSDSLGRNVSEFIFEKDIFDVKMGNDMLPAYALKGILSAKSRKNWGTMK